MPKKLRSRYIEPVRKKAGVAQLSRADLRFFGACLVKFVKEEARKDAKKSSQVPNNQDFFDSFSFVVRPSSIEIQSSWPWIDSLVEGTDAYPMEWLTQEAQGMSCVSEAEKKAIARRREMRTGTRKDGPPTIMEIVAQKKSKSVVKVPLRADNGEMIIRSLPCTAKDAWIHPAIAKHNFINRAFDRARETCLQNWAKKNLQRLLVEDQNRKRVR
jgi:hypothetical protein